MTRTFLTVAVLGVVSAAALAASGCASGTSNDQPYSLKGDTSPSNPSYSEQVEINRNHARGLPPPRATNGQ